MEQLKDFLLQLDEEYAGLSDFYELLKLKEKRLSENNKISNKELLYSLILLEKEYKFVHVAIEHINMQGEMLKWYTNELDEDNQIRWMNLSESIWKRYQTLKKAFGEIRREEKILKSKNEFSVESKPVKLFAIRDKYAEIINKIEKLSNALKMMAERNGCNF